MHPLEKAIADAARNQANAKRLIEALEAEIERLRRALNDAAEMSEHDDRTLIYNHCKQSVEG